MTEHELDHKTSFDKCKRTKVIESMFYDHNGNILEITEGILINIQICGE